MKYKTFESLCHGTGSPNVCPHNSSKRSAQTGPHLTLTILLRPQKKLHSPPKIWLRLPYIGKRGITLLQKFKKNLLRLIKRPCRLIVNWKTTTSTNCFLSCKDKTPKEYQSSVVYSFSFPGCQQSYIGKTDRCFFTRIKEHTTCPDSRIHNHINSCEQCRYIKSIFQISLDEQNSDKTLQISLWLCT